MTLYWDVAIHCSLRLVICVQGPNAVVRQLIVSNVLLILRKNSVDPSHTGASVHPDPDARHLLHIRHPIAPVLMYFFSLNFSPYHGQHP